MLRFGGQATGAIAQDGLNQPPERLRVLANREYWDKTPLAVAFEQDREADERSASALRAQREVWEQPLRGLEKPGGIGDIDFRSPPGTWPSDDRPTFHEQTGLIGWTSERFFAKVDFFLCANPDVPASASGCPSEDTVPLGTETFKGLTKDVTQYFSKLDLIKQTVVYQILKAVLVQDFVDCWRGSASGCAWAASNFIPGKAFAKVAEAIRALDAAMHTGVGIRDAFNALKALDLDPATLATIQGTVNAYEDVVTACKVNSFPGDTRVLMADGSHKAIRDVRVGDRLLAGDAGKGEPTAHPVTDTFRHPTRRLVDITLADGRLTSTAGHLFHVDGRGWTRVSELRTGDRLRTPDGTLHAVTALRDRDGLPPREVFDLTVGGPHTFYVRTEGTRPRDVLVHNCTDIIADEGIEGAHTLEHHVRIPDQQMAAKALAAKGGVATRWLDEATAARAVDEAMREWIKQPRATPRRCRNGSRTSPGGSARRSSSIRASTFSPSA